MAAGLTLEEDLIDLGWHQREFTLRHSFAYTVMAPDELLRLGRRYINPSDLPGFDAMAFDWARSVTSIWRKPRTTSFRRFVATIGRSPGWPFPAATNHGRSAVVRALLFLRPSPRNIR